MPAFRADIFAAGNAVGFWHENANAAAWLSGLACGGAVSMIQAVRRLYAMLLYEIVYL